MKEDIAVFAVNEIAKDQISGKRTAALAFIGAEGRFAPEQTRAGCGCKGGSP
jgi:hypothetical protein